jgi:hypothetical protein
MLTKQVMRIVCATTAALCLWHGSLAAAQPASRPVLVGGAASDEGCPGTATVAVSEGSTLNLRSGPGTTYPVAARLSPGQSVSICQRSGNGWVGVVVHKRVRGAGDCGLSDAGPRARPYGGPCESGWVKDEFLRLLAG